MLFCIQSMFCSVSSRSYWMVDCVQSTFLSISLPWSLWHSKESFPAAWSIFSSTFGRNWSVSAGFPPLHFSIGRDEREAQTERERQREVEREMDYNFFNISNDLCILSYLSKETMLPVPIQPSELNRQIERGKQETLHNHLNLSLHRFPSMAFVPDHTQRIENVVSQGNASLKYHQTVIPHEFL